MINKTLSALGNVVRAINGHSNFVPYRDSKLTRLLQDSIGGNSYTTLIAAVHPLANNFDECLSTCMFASNCRNISNRPVVNYLDLEGPRSTQTRPTQTRPTERFPSKATARIPESPS